MDHDEDEARLPERPGPRPAASRRSETPAGDDGPSTFRPNPIPAGAKRASRADRDGGRESARDREPVAASGGPSWFERILLGRISSGHLAQFCRQFASYQDSGVDLVRSLTSLQTQFGRTALGPVIGRLRAAVKGGEPLSDAMAREPQAFDGLCLSMMMVAEERGGVPETLRRLAHHYEARQRLIRQARSALIYPAFVLLTAFVVVMVLSIYVLPGFAGMLADLAGKGKAELPLPSRALMAFSAFISSHGWWSIPLATVAAVFALIWWYRTPAGKAMLDQLSLYIPVLGSLRSKIDTSRFARTLGALLAAGVDVGSSLDLTGRVMNLIPFRRAVAAIKAEVMHGAEMAEAMANTQRFGPDVIAIVGSGEESGRLPESLDKLADEYEEQVSYTVKNLGQLVQPLILFLMAGVVFFIVLAVLLPYIQAINSLAGGG